MGLLEFFFVALLALGTSLWSDVACKNIKNIESTSNLIYSFFLAKYSLNFKNLYILAEQSVGQPRAEDDFIFYQLFTRYLILNCDST
jgi:hypothetical protein